MTARALSALRVAGVMLVAFHAAAAIEATGAEGKKQIVIGYSGAASSYAYWATMTQAIRDAAAAEGAVLIDYSADDFSIDRQRANIAQAVEDEVDAFVVGPLGVEIADALGALETAQIPVVAVDRFIEHPWLLAALGTDDPAAGRLAGRHMVRLLGEPDMERNRVLIVSGDPQRVEDAVGRAEGMAAELRAAGFAPDIRYAPGWTGPGALKNAREALAEGGAAFVGVMSTYAYASLAVVEAADESGLPLKRVGYDFNDAMATMLREGRLDAAVAQAPDVMGRLAVEYLFQHFRGAPVPRVTKLPAMLLKLPPAK